MFSGNSGAPREKGETPSFSAPEAARNHTAGSRGQFGAKPDGERPPGYFQNGRKELSPPSGTKPEKACRKSKNRRILPQKSIGKYGPKEGKQNLLVVLFAHNFPGLFALVYFLI